MNISHQIHSIDRIESEAKEAALRYNDINDACPYPFGSVAAFVFKNAFNEARLTHANQSKETNEPS